MKIDHAAVLSRFFKLREGSEGYPFLKRGADAIVELVESVGDWPPPKPPANWLTMLEFAVVAAIFKGNRDRAESILAAAAAHGITVEKIFSYRGGKREPPLGFLEAKLLATSGWDAEVAKLHRRPPREPTEFQLGLLAGQPIRSIVAAFPDGERWFVGYGIPPKAFCFDRKRVRPFEGDIESIDHDDEPPPVWFAQPLAKPRPWHTDRYDERITFRLAVARCLDLTRYGSNIRIVHSGHNSNTADWENRGRWLLRCKTAKAAKTCFAKLATLAPAKQRVKPPDSFSLLYSASFDEDEQFAQELWRDVVAYLDSRPELGAVTRPARYDDEWLEATIAKLDL